jgi:hypothetical protein
MHKIIVGKCFKANLSIVYKLTIEKFEKIPGFLCIKLCIVLFECASVFEYKKSDPINNILSFFLILHIKKGKTRFIEAIKIEMSVKQCLEYNVFKNK